MSDPRSSVSAQAWMAGVAVLIMLHAVLLLINAWRLSPTSDEFGHFYAGLRLWDDFDNSIFCVNPPLVRAIATTPAYLMGVRSDPPRRWSLEGRVEFPLGREKFREHPHLFRRALFFGRTLCSGFSVGGLLMLLLVAKAYHGNAASLVCGTLWAFQPEIISHGSLITNDIPVAVCMFASSVAFVSWLQHPTKRSLVAVSLAFALALLCKFSALALLPIFLVFVLAYRPLPTLKLCAHFTAFVVIVWLIFCAAYGFAGVGRSLGSFEFISPGWRGDVGLEQISGNAWRESFVGAFPIPAPEDAVIGVDVQKHDFETGTLSYCAGERRSAWWFYLYALAVKLPTGTLLAFATAAICLLGKVNRVTTFEAVAIAFVYFFLFLTSFADGIGQQHRYVFPVLPFAIALVGFAWAYGAQLTRWLLAASSAVTAIFCFWVAPHWLPAFNALAGGTSSGHHHLFNDATDWGQDCQRLANLANQVPPDVAVLISSQVNSAENLHAVGLDRRVDVTTNPMLSIRRYLKEGVPVGYDRMEVFCSKTDVAMDPELAALIEELHGADDFWGSHLHFTLHAKGE